MKTTTKKTKRSYKPAIKSGSFLSSHSSTGLQVDENTALNCAAVWRAISLLSGSVAQLPIGVYADKDGEKQKYPDHPVAKLLHRSPNKEMTAYQFRETSFRHMLLYGNSFAEIERLKNGTPYALYLIPPDKVTVSRDSKGEFGEKDALIYIVKSDNNQAVLTADKMLHVAGPSHNGVIGLGRIRLAAESVGYCVALEKFGNAFMGNGTRPSGVLKAKSKVSDTAQANLRKSLQSHTGYEHTAKVMILEEGLEWQSISISPDEAQFLESRRFSIEEISRWFNLRPQWLDATNTGGTPEHLGIDFVKWTLQPDLIRYEQEYNRKLFKESESNYFVKHNVDSLIRGDIASRYQAYNIGLTNKFLTVNEVRQREDLPPIAEPPAV